MTKEGFSTSISFEIEPTEENKATINKLLEDFKQEEQRIVAMLMESARLQVNDYIAQGACIGDTDTFKAIIYNAMAEGWNQCYIYHKDKIEKL